LTAIVLAALSALLFGGMSIGLRKGLSRHDDVHLASLICVGTGTLVGLVAVLVEAPSRGVDLAGIWPFVLAGVLSPGAAQICITRAIRDAGSSRTSVVLGTAPLVSIAMALLFLHEPLRWPLMIAALFIVVGCLELAWEKDRPGHVRRIGFLYALLGTVLFSARDNLLRWLSIDTSVSPAVAAVAGLVGGLIFLVLFSGRRKLPGLRPTLPFFWAGLSFGLSYICLYEAYYRGRVTVVSPLIATEALWGVVLSVIFLRHTELVGKRLALGTLLVVAGGVMIGVFR
jgi:drug/metabolite transporter (DMT)-like permease